MVTMHNTFVYGSGTQIGGKGGGQGGRGVYMCACL